MHYNSPENILLIDLAVVTGGGESPGAQTDPALHQRSMDWGAVGRTAAAGAGAGAVTGAAVGAGVGLAAGGVATPLTAAVGAVGGAAVGGYMGLLAGTQSQAYWSR